MTPPSTAGAGRGQAAADRPDGSLDADQRECAAGRAQDPRAAGRDCPVIAARRAARPPGRTAVEPAPGGTGPRLAAPGNSSAAGNIVTGRDRDPVGDPRSPLAPPGRGLGGRGGGDAGDHRPAGVAVAAGRRPAGGPGRHRSHLRRLADHRARTAARPCPHRGRGAAARAGGAGGGDPGRAAPAADRSRARGCLAGADAGARGARRARHGDPGL